MGKALEFPQPARGPRGLIPLPPQDLLKHTPEDHPDHPLLLDAQRNIKQVAERINKGVRSAEEAERHARVLQEIEAHIEGMEDVSPARTPGVPRSRGHVPSVFLPVLICVLFQVSCWPRIPWPDDVASSSVSSALSLAGHGSRGPVMSHREGS